MALSLAPGQPVVLFDGACALCNRAMAALIRADRHGVFRVAGGAGEVGRQLLSRCGLDADVGTQSIVLIEGDRALAQSDAVVRILSLLPPPFSLGGLGKWVPRRLRDALYGVVRDHRRKISDGDIDCGVPPPELCERWMQRLVEPADLQPNVDVHHFEFAFDRRFWLALWLWGVRPSRAFVRVGEGRLLVRFGHLWVDTPLANIENVQITRNYRWWTAIGGRESFVDHGASFGTNADSGVCICFVEKVSALATGRRHPALTVTVADQDGFVCLVEDITSA